MATRGISHVAVGVSDMDASLEFYRDLLGLDVSLDTIEGAFTGDANAYRRRAVYLRANSDPGDSFVVLDQLLDEPPRGRPPRILDLGTHHFSFWVDDVRAVFEQAVACGHRAILRPTEADAEAYGEAPGSARFLTAILKDPDGNPVQLDERTPAT